MPPARSALPQPQPSASAQTSSISVPGRTARASSAVNRPAGSSHKSTADVAAAQCSNGLASSVGLNAGRGKTSADQKSRPSGLPCPPPRSQTTACGRGPASVGSASRADGTSSAELRSCNSLPSAKTRALSANGSASGLVPPGSGSKVARPPTRSLSRNQGGGIKSGRQSAEPPPRAGVELDDGRTHSASSGTVASTGVDRSQGQSSTRSATSTPQTSVRRTSKLLPPRASSASKTQRKPVSTSVPTVDVGPPVACSSNTASSVTAREITRNHHSLTSSNQHVTAKSSTAVVRQLSADCGASSSSSVPDVAGASQPSGAVSSLDGAGDATTDSQPSPNRSSKMPPRCSSAPQTSLTDSCTDQSAPSIGVAPCSDVTELPEAVDSALGVAPMQPMTSRAYMTSSGNPMMTSRLLSASQRPFTPLTGAWSARQTTLTNGYVSDSDLRPLSGTLRHSGYLSEGASSLRYDRRSRNLPSLHAMRQYLENVEDDEDRRAVVF